VQFSVVVEYFGPQIVSGYVRNRRDR